LSLTVSVQPAVEPITRDEAKAHLRVGVTDDDFFIDSCITAARQNLEETYRLACITQTLILGLDYFVQPDWDPWSPVWPVWPAGWWLATSWYPRGQPLELRWPLQSVTSIAYTDPSGNPQTFPSNQYQVVTQTKPGLVMPNYGVVWPVASPLPNNIQVTFVAGYANPSLVPSSIKAALKLIIGDLYENREQSLIGTRLVVVELPRGVDDLMGPYKFQLVR